jgi:hypothetical protein
VTATNATPPPDGTPEPGPGKPVPVFVLNGTRTSDGPGPGLKHLPLAEAGALVAARLAVHGGQPPQGWPG